MVLVFGNVALPSGHGLVLTDHDFFGDLVEQSDSLSVMIQFYCLVEGLT
jgi:hypothetical protein